MSREKLKKLWLPRCSCFVWGHGRKDGGRQSSIMPSGGKTVKIKPEDRRHLDLYYITKEEVLYEPQNISYQNSNCGYTYSAPKLDFELNENNFGDEYFFFESTVGNPQYDRVEKVWNEFIRWIRKRLKQMENQAEEYSYEMKIGRQLIDFAKNRNAHGMYILMKRNWVEFRDPYLCFEGCPDSIMEFVRGIMHEKMTEKQMWGGDEERMPGGTVILFDKIQSTHQH